MWGGAWSSWARLAWTWPRWPGVGARNGALAVLQHSGQDVTDLGETVEVVGRGVIAHCAKLRECVIDGRVPGVRRAILAISRGLRLGFLSLGEVSHGVRL